MHTASLYYKTDDFERLTAKELIDRVAQGVGITNMLSTELVQSCKSWQELEDMTVVRVTNRLYHGKHVSLQELEEFEIAKVIGDVNVTKWKQQRTAPISDTKQELLQLYNSLPESVKKVGDIQTVLKAMLRISE